MTGPANTPMKIEQRLGELLLKIKNCSADEYLPLSGQIAREIADLPVHESAAVLDWTSRLYQQVKTGDESFDVLATFAQGLAARHDQNAADLLGRIMVDEEMHLTEDVAEWLEEMGSAARPAVPYLIQVLEHQDETWPRAKAAQTLGAIGDRSARDALVAALRDSDGTVRNAALDALVSLNLPVPLTELMDLATGDQDYLVRTSALRAVGRWYPRELNSVLEKLGDETNPTVQKAIADLKAAKK